MVLPRTVPTCHPHCGSPVSKDQIRHSVLPARGVSSKIGVERGFPDYLAESKSLIVESKTA
jgi:hypothetical protein